MRSCRVRQLKRKKLKAKALEPFVDAAAIVALDFDAAWVDGDDVTVAHLGHLASQLLGVAAEAADDSQTACAAVAIVGIDGESLSLDGTKDAEREVIVPAHWRRPAGWRDYRRVDLAQ